MDAPILLSPVGQKTETRFNCFLTENRKSTEMVGTPSTVCVYSFHRCGGPPPSKREVLGLRRSRPAALPSIAYRGFAVAPMTLRAPARNVVVITIQISGCGKYKKRARNARPYGVRRCNRRLQMHLTVAISLPKDLPPRGRGTVRRRWKELSDGGRSKQTVEGVHPFTFP